MTPEEAVERLREAGLYCMGSSDHRTIRGGSHVDASSGIRMVQNGYMIVPQQEQWWVRRGLDAGTPFPSLEGAVQHVLDTLRPEPNIEPPPRPPSGGTVLY